MYRFQYSEALIRRMLWDQICSQFLLALVFIFLAAGIDSLVTGREWVRGAIVGVLCAGVVLPAMAWRDWMLERRTLQSTIIEIGEREICCSISGGSLFRAVRQESILISELSAIFYGPYGWTFLIAKLKRGIHLPRGTAESNALVEEFLKRLPSSVSPRKANFSRIWLAVVFVVYGSSLLICLLIGSNALTGALISSMLLYPAANGVLGPSIRRLREKIWPLSLEREAQI